MPTLSSKVDNYHGSNMLPANVYQKITPPPNVNKQQALVVPSVWNYSVPYYN